MEGERERDTERKTRNSKENEHPNESNGHSYQCIQEEYSWTCDNGRPFIK